MRTTGTALSMYEVEVLDEYERFSCTMRVRATSEDEAWQNAVTMVRSNPRAQTWTMRPEARQPDFDGFHRGTVRWAKE